MPITITTWNIQNFTRSDTAYTDKLALLTNTLRSLAADVVALQEVLDPDALSDLADGLGFQSVAAEPDGRGIRVAFLCRDAPVQAPRQIDQWRLPPDTPVRRLDSAGSVTVDARFPRPALQITMAHNGAEVDIITAHLKSKLLTFGGKFSTTDERLRAQTAYFALARRAAEATTLREQVTDLLAAGRQVIVLGDMNDGPEAATTQILYGPPGSQPRGPDDAQRRAGAFQRADANDPRRLFNVTKLVPEAQRWSRRHNGQNELLDHILSSQGLMPRVDGLRQVPEVQILNDDAPHLTGEDPNQGGVFPDHAPVTATFV